MGRMYPVGVSKQARAVNGAARLPRKLPETRLRCRPMFVRMPSFSRSSWRRAGLGLVLLALPLSPGCTKSEDTEPFVPAVEGATQPTGSGSLISEDDACDRLLKAAGAAYKRLGCDAPTFAKCPDYLRPGGGNGCYEYYDDSVSACDDDGRTPPGRVSRLSPCLPTGRAQAVSSPTCDLGTAEGGASAGGAATGEPTSGGASEGGAAPMSAAGAPSAGEPPMAAAGQAAGGAG